MPLGWEKDSELTWALRDLDGEFLGVIGLRLTNSDLGFWLGAPHRGHGYMPAAVRLVTDWVFSTGFGGLTEIHWQAIMGNTASLAVARKAGFTYTGVGPATTASRDGSHPTSWNAVLRHGDSAAEKPGWPVS